MASRKEQKEALRAEREAREQEARAAERRRRLIGYGAGGVLALAAVVTVVVLLVSGGGGGGDKPGETGDVLPGGGEVPKQQETELRAAARAAECKLESTKARSRDHTQDEAEKIEYDTNPPSSGRHYEIPADDGAFGESPGVLRLVHSLEHGRVIIWFKPGLPKDTRANLKALFDQDNYQLILTPKEDMPYEVAATAWNAKPPPLGMGRLLGCPRVGDRTYDALRAFSAEHRGAGPEPVP